MKKFFNALAFTSKLLLLVVFLLFGWVFVNVTNLVKGKKVHPDGEGFRLPGIDPAHADVPAASAPSTPFLAYFDGIAYRIENDILFGRPRSYFRDFATALAHFRAGRIAPDLYKIGAPVSRENGNFRFQIQEIEPEESFIGWIELKRVLHPKETEAFVDSEFRKYFVLDRAKIRQHLTMPEIVAQAGADAGGYRPDVSSLWTDQRSSRIRFQPDGSIRAVFQGLEPGKPVFLLAKTWFRDWTMGDVESWNSCLKSWQKVFSQTGLQLPATFTAALGVGVALLLWFLQKHGASAAAASLPFFIGDCPSTFDPGSSYTPHCLHYAYRQKEKFHTASIHETRAWKPASEIIELPAEAVQKDGTLELEVRSTKRHELHFLGAIQNIQALETKAYREEILPLSRAWHSRLKTNVADDLRADCETLVHTVPGDTLELEFTAGNASASDKETLLFRSSGFYTALTPPGRRLAGNWRAKISSEARARLSSLTGVIGYR